MPSIPQTAAIHALTVGGVGTMVLAVMTRVCRGHTGRPLTADWLAILIYVLVSLAALTRVSAALLPSYLMRLLRSAEHPSGLPSPLRRSYAVFRLTKKNPTTPKPHCIT